MGIPSFRIGLAMEKEEWKHFAMLLASERERERERKKFLMKYRRISLF
jgi:hypothetical protein